MHIKHKEIIQAWLNGAKIQFKNGTFWEDCDDNKPSFLENLKYRVKPKSKTVFVSFCKRKEDRELVFAVEDEIMTKEYFQDFNNLKHQLKIEICEDTMQILSADVLPII